MGGRPTEKKEQWQLTADQTQHICSNMERSTERQKLTSIRQQQLVDDPGVSAQSSTRP